MKTKLCLVLQSWCFYTINGGFFCEIKFVSAERKATCFVPGSHGILMENSGFPGGTWPLIENKWHLLGKSRFSIGSKLYNEITQWLLRHERRRKLLPWRKRSISRLSIGKSWLLAWNLALMNHSILQLHRLIMVLSWRCTEDELAFKEQERLV